MILKTLSLISTFAAGAITILPSARAELISMEMTGKVTSNSTPATNLEIGTPWRLSLVYDTAAQDTNPDPAVGFFTNSTAIPAIRSFDFTLGDYTASFDQASGTGISVLISLSRNFSFDLQGDSAVLGALQGRPVAIIDFELFGQGRSFNGGTDGLPTDLSFNETDFLPAVLEITTSSSGFIDGTPETIAFAAVPEPPSGSLLAIALLSLLAWRVSWPSVGRALKHEA